MARSFAHDARRTSLTVAPLLLALSIWMAAADDPPDAPAALGGFATSGGSLSGFLSTPLPGTQARADADAASRLEQALRGFDGVVEAHVLLARPSADPSASPDVAAQLRLRPEFRPTDAWLETVRIFSLRTVPSLRPDRLTIVTSDGRILFEAGEALLPTVSTPRTPVLDETFRFEPWWLFAAAAIGFVLVSCGLLLHRLMNHESARAQTDAAEGPLEFLRDVPDETIAHALARERPEMISAMLALAPAEVAERLRRREDLPGQLPAPAGPLDEATVTALADALRRRLAE